MTIAEPLLLDTHTWIWYAHGETKLGPKSKAEIDSAIAASRAFISAVSLRELGMLVRKRRIELVRNGVPITVRAWAKSATRRLGVRVISVSGTLALASLDVVDLIDTKDPTDHIIVATAQNRAAVLVSADESIRAFGATGALAVMDASK